jgi:hypothetical protein
MALSTSSFRDLLEIRYALSRAQLDVRRLRLSLALRRFNPAQPRVPAGHPDGGQWTDGGGSEPRTQVVSLRPRAPTTRIIAGRAFPVTPAQEARLDMSAARARALIREVHRHDPSWRPRPSIYEAVEGQIRANEWDAMQATARLQQLGRQEPEGRSLSDVLMPGGRPLGTRENGAGADAWTVRPSTFRDLLEAVSPGAQIVPSPAAYRGLWFRRPDGSIVGLRRSEKHGITLDIIQNNHPTIGNGYKVHQK